VIEVHDDEEAGGRGERHYGSVTGVHLTVGLAFLGEGGGRGMGR
jgi:hypothetical protein